MTDKPNIKDVLHHYIGCECEVTTTTLRLSPSRTDTRIIDVQLLVQLSIASIYSYEVKPRLTPLSDISEEQARILIGLGNPDWRNVSIREKKPDGRIHYFYTNVNFPDAGRGDAHLDFNKLNFAQFTWGCSQGIDFGELIESGQAINKKGDKK